MSFLPNNSTNIPLGANQEFIGEPCPVDESFVSVQCSFDSNVGGTVEFYPVSYTHLTLPTNREV